MKKREEFKILCKACHLEYVPAKDKNNMQVLKEHRHAHINICRKLVAKTVVFYDQLLTAGHHYFCREHIIKIGHLLR